MNEVNQMNEPGSGAEQQSVSSTGSQAMETVQQRAGMAREEVAHVADSAKDEMRSFADEARTQVREQVDQQGAQLGDAVHQFGSQLTGMASNADDPQQPSARAVRQIGDRVTSAADRFEQRGVDGLLDDIKRFARQHPGQFIAGAAAAGFLVGRLLRNVDTSAVTDQMTGNGQQDQDERSVIDLTGEASAPSAPADPAGGAGSAGSTTGVGSEEVGAW
jgi:ElaB/YqjD/DUF883 family membrane-anchored ribosome-binding protein